MLGYFLALLIGLSLGILGGGGSILTVPVLVYIMGFGPKLAIALSLAIVGGTSLLGVYGHYKNKNIDFFPIFYKAGQSHSQKSASKKFYK